MFFWGYFNQVSARPALKDDSVNQKDRGNFKCWLVHTSVKMSSFLPITETRTHIVK